MYLIASMHVMTIFKYISSQKCCLAACLPVCYLCSKKRYLVIVSLFLDLLSFTFLYSKNEEDGVRNVQASRVCLVPIKKNKLKLKFNESFKRLKRLLCLQKNYLTTKKKKKKFCICAYITQDYYAKSYELLNNMGFFWSGSECARSDLIVF